MARFMLCRNTWVESWPYADVTSALTPLLRDNKASQESRKAYLL